MLLEFIYWYQKVFYGRNRKINLIFVGPPGSGKSTQAALVTAKYGNCYIQTDDMLKSLAKSGTKLGQIVQGLLNEGKPVPDALMMDLLDEKICSEECDGGILLDGFPKSVEQTKLLARLMGKRRMPLNGVIEFKSDDATLEKRIPGRLYHEASGRIYNESLLPPKIPGRDDLTGDTLVRRPDDTIDNLKKRLKEYKEIMPPVLHRYESMRCSVNATKSPDQVFENVVKQIEYRKKMPI